MAAVRVQHWIACLHSEVAGPVSPHNHYNLFGVGYVHVAPPETEFPWVFRTLDMFARFVGGIGTKQFEVRLDWMDAPDGPRRVEIYGPIQVEFRPDEPVRNHVVRLRNVPVPGPGRYRFRLCEIMGRKLPLLATEYIEVRREP